jgi:hypothetical protein
LSFFDDDEPPEPPRRTRTEEPRHDEEETRAPAPRRPARPRSRRDTDHQTLVVRRAVALGVGLVLVFLIAFLISHLMHSAKLSSLRSYAQNAAALVAKADPAVAVPFFNTLNGAGQNSIPQVEFAIGLDRTAAQDEAQQASSWSVPGDMAAAQRSLLLLLDLRTEAITRVINLIQTAINGTNGSALAFEQIAGANEMLLTSDVLYAERVYPLITEALAKNGITGITLQPTTQFLPNIGWLDPTLVQERLTGTGGQGTGAAAATANTCTSGNCGHMLGPVSVAGVTLSPSVVNHIPGASGVVFTISVVNDGAQAEHNVKVDLSVGSASTGKPQTQSKDINTTTPGQPIPLQIPLTSPPPTGTVLQAKVKIEGVPGENDLVNNRGTFLVLFG